MTEVSLTEKVVSKIDMNHLKELLIDLIRIPSVNPPGNEGPLAHFIMEWAKMHSLEVMLDEVYSGRPNVYIIIRGSKRRPNLIFNGHLDVVPEGEHWSVDPFEGKVIEDKIFGRGAADMKAAIAAMLMAAKALNESDIELSGDLIITLVVDEEVYGKGTQQVISKGITADYAVVSEPTSLNVAIASKGDVNFEVKTYGKAAHSSRPQDGLNAIYKMRKIIEAIEKHSDELKKKHHPLLGNPTISITLIEGGTTPWIIPENCKIVIDRRTLPGENSKSVLEELESIILKIKETDPEMVSEVSILQEACPAEISPREEIVSAVLNEASSVLGRNVEIIGMSGTTDARFLINDAKIPTVIFGPGSLAQAHQPDEYVNLSETYLAAKIYARIALRL